jgi:hypothetical protein
MSACIDFDGSCVNQRTVDVEDPEGTILIKGRAGLHSSYGKLKAMDSPCRSPLGRGV